MSRDFDANQGGNLPEWPGAAVVYSRCAAICNHLCREEYKAQTAKRKGRALKRFYPPEAATVIIDAMNRGDEEYLKGTVLQYPQIVHAGALLADTGRLNQI